MAYHIIRPRSGKASEWESANPILAEREIGFEVPDGGVGTGIVKMKMGDGSTNWNALPYAIIEGLSTDIIETDLESASDEAIPSVSAICNLIDNSLLSTPKMADSDIISWLRGATLYNVSCTVSASSTSVSNVPYGGSGVVWILLAIGTNTKRTVIACRGGSNEIYIRDWSGTTWGNAWTRLAIESDCVKTEFKLMQTSTLTGNADHNITVQLPDEYEVIEAIVPVSFVVTADWNTQLLFTSIDVSTSKLGVHTVGATSQSYIIGYYIHYK